MEVIVSYILLFLCLILILIGLYDLFDELQKMKKTEHETEARKEIMGLETRNEQLEKEKMIILREKNELSADLEKIKKDLKRISKERDTCGEERGRKAGTETQGHWVNCVCI